MNFRNSRVRRGKFRSTLNHLSPNRSSGIKRSPSSESYFLYMGQPWFYYLKGKDQKRKTPALLEKVTIDDGNLIVHATLEGRRLFAKFENPSIFLKYESIIPHQNRCFYETVIGQRKPYFDIDINLQRNQDVITSFGKPIERIMSELITDLVSAIISVMQSVGIIIDIYRDVLLFSSHGPTKKSFHLIIDHYYHENHEEAKAFAKLVISKISSKYRSWIDDGVYTSIRQFRLEGSHKANSNRVKKFENSWIFIPENDSENLNWEQNKIKYQFPTRFQEGIIDGLSSSNDENGKNDNDQNLGNQRELIFCSSLLGYLANSQKLPPFQPLLPLPAKPNKSITSTGWLTDEEGMIALELLAQMADTSTSDPRFPYEYIRTEGGLVLLKRIRPSMCRICHRIHENENPYLVIVPSKKLSPTISLWENISSSDTKLQIEPDKIVYFNCRRNVSNQCLYVGRLSMSNGEIRSTTGQEFPIENLLTDEELLKLPIFVPKVDDNGQIIEEKAKQIITKKEFSLGISTKEELAKISNQTGEINKDSTSIESLNCNKPRTIQENLPNMIVPKISQEKIFLNLGQSARLETVVKSTSINETRSKNSTPNLKIQPSLKIKQTIQPNDFNRIGYLTYSPSCEAPFHEMMKIASGMTYQTKSGKIRNTGKVRSMSEYQPPLEAMAGITF